MKRCYSFFFLLLPFILPAKTISLADALDRNMIELEVSGLDRHTGKSLSLKIRHTEKKSWTLEIPAGFIFNSVDTSIQDMMVVQARLVELEKHKTGFAKLYSLCVQASNGAPSKEQFFKPGGLSTGPLLNLATFLDKKRLSDMDAQYAVWAVTDQKPLTNISNPELVVFTADLLGLDVPNYSIIHNQSPSNPGRAAYQESPAIVQGVFKYETKGDVVASFGFYNSEGQLLDSLFENVKQREGHHKFKFYFEVVNLPPGKYAARLVDQNGNTVEELSLEF